MGAVVVGSWVVPPDRWMVELAPVPETFGSVVRRLRLDRGWSQRDVARRTSIDQTEISKFERDAYRYRKEDIVAAYEDVFGMTRGSLSHLPWGDATRETPSIPGPSVAIPQEPELIEAVRALFLYEPEELPGIASYLRDTKRTPKTENAEKRRAG